MRSGKFRFMSATGMLGAMTEAERAKGRYMRAPDHDEFAEFEASGTVEVGSEQKSVADGEVEKPAAKKPGGSGKPPKEKDAGKPAAKPAVESNVPGDDTSGDADKGDDAEDEGEEGEGEGEGEEKPAKPRQKASDRIRDLNKRLRDSERLRLASDERLTRLEKSLLPGEKAGGKTDALGDAPNPQDTEKYPFGHLDERYVEDRLQYLVKKTAGEQADAALQREQGNARTAEAQRAQAALLEKVDLLSDRGSAEYEDYQEKVVDAGMKGEWDLGQATFEAASETDYGYQILYDLSQDTKEATRVAKLSPTGQIKYVLEREAEIAATKKPRTKPGAGAPPETQTRGASSRTRINPATENLDDFEKAWEADAKGKR